MNSLEFPAPSLRVRLFLSLRGESFMDYFVSDLPGRSRRYEQDQHRRFVELLTPVEYPAVEVIGWAGVHIQFDELSVVHDTPRPLLDACYQ